ncbi:hypothetical protein REPUB_Repub06bG0020900 [Reevesia pubescens]
MIEDIARFARLTRLEDFFLDKDASRLHGSFDISDLYNVTVYEAKSTGDLSHIGYSLGSQKTRRVLDKGCKDQHFHIPPLTNNTSSTSATRT